MIIQGTGTACASLDRRHHWLRRTALARLWGTRDGDGDVYRCALRRLVNIEVHELPEGSAVRATARDAAYYRAGQLAIIDELLHSVVSLSVGE